MFVHRKQALSFGPTFDAKKQISFLPCAKYTEVAFGWKAGWARPYLSLIGGHSETLFWWCVGVFKNVLNSSMSQIWRLIAANNAGPCYSLDPKNHFLLPNKNCELKGRPRPSSAIIWPPTAQRKTGQNLPWSGPCARKTRTKAFHQAYVDSHKVLASPCGVVREPDCSHQSGFMVID